jgi:PD-(D/E)XK nuclease superfamily
MRVSQSKIKTWLRCRRASHYKYIEGLRRKTPPRPLKFGSMMHRMMEFEKNGHSFKRAIAELQPDDRYMFEQQVEEYGDLLNDASDIMASYKAYYKRDGIKYAKLQGKRSEFEMEMDLGKGITLVGIIDFIAKTENVGRWLGDHKTYGQALDDEALWKNIQSMAYHRIWEANGNRPLAGTLWDMVWSKAPTMPEFTKSGEISKRQIVTLPETLHRFFALHKIDPKEHSELLDIAYNNRSRYFRRVFMPRMPRVEKTLFYDFKQTAFEIKRRLGKDKRRTIDKHCNWCEYRLLCQAKMLGLDYRFTKRNHYIVDETRTDDRVTTGD